MSIRRVLITGGLGYVGGRLAQFLAQDPAIHLLLGTRSVNRPAPSWITQGQLVHVDLTDERSLVRACSGVDTVIHLAAANEIDSAKDRALALQVNGLGSLKLLEASEQAGVARFIFFSTAHVYGAPLCGTINENTMARPIHPYAITHRVAEDFVLASHSRGRILGIVIRLSNAVGAPVDPSVNRWTLVANDLCRQAAETQTLRLQSAGLQIRDFVPLEDVCRATNHLMELSRDALSDGLFNLGGKTPLRIFDLATLIAARCIETLGFCPTIARPDVTAGQAVVGPLDYRIDKLESTGFALRGEIDAEIDSTLKLCAAYGASAT